MTSQIKTAQGRQWLTIPVHSAGATQGVPIKDVKMDWSKPWAKNHWKTLSMAYAKAPFFQRYTALLEPFYQREDVLLADFTIDLTIALAGELGLGTRFMRSSSLPGIDGQKTDRLIQILRQVGCTHYISGPSARDYIEQDRFDAAGMTLEYIQYDYPEYPQLYPPFEGQVSILDLLFMTGPDASKYFVKK